MIKVIYTITALIAFAVSANAQVGIEIQENEISAKAILDFPDDADGTILLPYVENAVTESVSGTLIYDTTDGIVRYKDNGGDWVSLGSAPIDSNNIVKHDATLSNNVNDNGVVISDLAIADQVSVPGVLVLESNSKALALPKVNGVENLESPKAGMICFDTSRHALAIYNGEMWILRN